ncbi:MAG: hypothetical protein V3V85_04890 [Candidatus Thorarchaeota archaeon]
MEVSRKEIVKMIAEENPVVVDMIQKMVIDRLQKQIQVVREKMDLSDYLICLDSLGVKILEIEHCIVVCLGDDACIKYDVRKGMFSQFQRVIDSYKESASDAKDSEMKDCYTQDAKNMTEILDLMKAGEYKKAYEKARHLDTAVRECIPIVAWEYMQVKAEGRSI